MTRRPPPRDSSAEAVAALFDEVEAIGLSHGLDALGVASVAPLIEARLEIKRRVELGLHDSMKFTFSKPDRSTSPADLLPGAQALVVAARSYRRADEPSPEPGPNGRIARYAWLDHYQPLREALTAMGVRIRRDGWRTRVVADDNALVDRAAAYRAGIGWLGKNANILLPGAGSWFVLGSLVTTAPFIANSAPLDDGCGACVRCIDGCPTAAIVAPGVVDGRRCLAWLVQRPGVFPEEFAEALADRIYGCDDCQEVCPPNRTIERRLKAPDAEPGAQPWTDLVTLATDTDATILSRHGRFYLPDRDPSTLRRNALLALGNVADPNDEHVLAVVDGARSHADAGVQAAADWALGRLEARRENRGPVA